MAASGGYERLPHRLLSGRAVPIAVVNAARARDFGRAGGRPAGTARLDAELIARYGAFARPAPASRPSLALVGLMREMLTTLNAMGRAGAPRSAAFVHTP